jgi:hypothetical protein
LVTGLLDKRHGVVKVEVLTEALAFDVLGLVVILVGDELGIEVIGSLQRPVKAALVRVVFSVPAEVPFADVAGLVARCLENLGQDRGLFPEVLARIAGVGDTIAELMHAGHQGRTSGGAGGADVEIVKAHALIVKAVRVWGAEQGVAVAGEVPVSLVIGEDEDDVGLFTLLLFSS